MKDKITKEELKQKVIDRLNSFDQNSEVHRIKDVLINAIMSSNNDSQMSKEEANFKLKQFDNILSEANNSSDYYHVDKTKVAGKSELEILVFDYLECIKATLNGKVEQIVRFVDNNFLLFEVSSGLIDLSAITSEECDLKECVLEIEAIVSEYNYSLRKIKKAVNDQIMLDN